MASRDPYHHLSLRAYTCRDSRTEAQVLERAAVRRARHAGKREAHGQRLDADWILYEDADARGWYDFDWCNPAEFACSDLEPACSVALATLADVA